MLCWPALLRSRGFPRHILLAAVTVYHSSLHAVSNYRNLQPWTAVSIGLDETDSIPDLLSYFLPFPPFAFALPVSSVLANPPFTKASLAAVLINRNLHGTK